MSWTLNPKYVPANVKWARQAPTHLNDTISALQGRPRDVSTLRPRPTTLSERIASAIVPDGRKWTDMRNKVSGAVDALTPLGAEQPLRDARSAYQGGNRLTGLGLGALAALGAIPGEGIAERGLSKARGIFGKKGIIAYHGSPHSFDKFSLDKIGTGEGAQAYGHGLYFAEKEGVAKSYRDALAGAGKLIVDGPSGVKKLNAEKIASRLEKKYDPEMADEFREYLRMIGQGDMTIADMKRDFFGQAARSSWGRDVYSAIRDAKGVENTGSMYQVRINADPNDFLDWDAPVAKNLAPVAQKHLGDMAQYAKTNGQLVHKIGTTDVVPDLKAAGYPGIKYLDQGSRGAGEGSRNYVVFDDALIEILKKYGIAVPAMGLGVAGMSRQPEGGM